MGGGFIFCQKLGLACYIAAEHKKTVVYMRMRIVTM